MQTRKRGRPILSISSRCTGCLICELRCSLRFDKTHNPALAKISIRRLVNGETEYGISFSEGCDSCGICARYCPYGALIPKERGGT